MAIKSENALTFPRLLKEALLLMLGVRALLITFVVFIFFNSTSRLEKKVSPNKL